MAVVDPILAEGETRCGDAVHLWSDRTVTCSVLGGTIITFTTATEEEAERLYNALLGVTEIELN